MDYNVLEQPAFEWTQAALIPRQASHAHWPRNRRPSLGTIKTRMGRPLTGNISPHDAWSAFRKSGCGFPPGKRDKIRNRAYRLLMESRLQVPVLSWVIIGKPVRTSGAL